MFGYRSILVKPARQVANRRARRAPWLAGVVRAGKRSILAQLASPAVNRRYRRALWRVGAVVSTYVR
jgi:hypothetical protein